jgi:hypothetical protein
MFSNCYAASIFDFTTVDRFASVGYSAPLLDSSTVDYARLVIHRKFVFILQVSNVLFVRHFGDNLRQVPARQF